MNERSYLLDIAGLILCIVMISIVAILINFESKDGDLKIERPAQNLEVQNYSANEY